MGEVRVMGVNRCNIAEQKRRHSLYFSGDKELSFFLDPAQLIPVDNGLQNLLFFPGDDFHLKRRSDDGLVPVDIIFSKVFSIFSKDALLGCHGRYPQKRIMRYGGDPLCGGGIHYAFPSESREAYEIGKVSSFVKGSLFKRIFRFKNSLDVHLVMNEDPYDHHFSKFGGIFHADMLIGDDSQIKNYRYQHNVRTRKIQIVID
ncbi:hypothetical protein HY249_00720 [Candidatus Azambacteria bacterium]|nr:hypothetical protein [Candidatus Azambacteria bacterium]